MIKDPLNKPGKYSNGFKKVSHGEDASTSSVIILMLNAVLLGMMYLLIR